MVGLIAAPAAAQNGVMGFRGIRDASAAVALDDQRIIVGDDEKPWLSIYRLSDAKREERIDLPSDSEPEIEGATVIDGRIVWITSHGRNSEGESKPKRQALFSSHRLGTNGTSWVQAFSTRYTGLLAAILSPKSGPAYDPLRVSIGTAKDVPKLAPKKDGFNIEGIAHRPDTKQTFVGMRNPASDKGAYVFELQNPEALIDDKSKVAALGKVFPIFLDGRTIRDIAWSPVHAAFLIIGGPIDDDDAVKGKVGYGIYKWSGKEADRPVLVPAFDFVNTSPPRFRPEAIVPLKDRTTSGLRDSKRIMLIGDDGTRPVGGVECKKAPDDQKSFRAVIRVLD